MTYTITFADENNGNELIGEVRTYLQQDNLNRQNEGDHCNGFYHNIGMIVESIVDGKALVARKDDEFAGFMTWTDSPGGIIEIVIVEVAQAHRQKGVFKLMQQQLIDHLDGVVLYANYLDLTGATEAFNSSGWVQYSSQFSGDSHYGGSAYKCLCDTELPLSVCPQSGPAIAFGNSTVYHEPTQITYYPISVNADGKLSKPILHIERNQPESFYEPLSKSYMQLIFNQEVVAKARILDGFPDSEGRNPLFQFSEIKAAKLLSIFSLTAFRECDKYMDWKNKAINFCQTPQNDAQGGEEQNSLGAQQGLGQ